MAWRPRAAMHAREPCEIAGFPADVHRSRQPNAACATTRGLLPTECLPIASSARSRQTTHPGQWSDGGAGLAHGVLLDSRLLPPEHAPKTWHQTAVQAAARLTHRHRRRCTSAAARSELIRARRGQVVLSKGDWTGGVVRGQGVSSTAVIDVEDAVPVVPVGHAISAWPLRGTGRLHAFVEAVPVYGVRTQRMTWKNGMLHEVQRSSDVI
ncbi:hypothetical protein BC628DRAFT_353026 [Trametes gibbosa]|nr:hypothetical protein BC628DRAFT_353026 [Trametes gibbosa]